MRLKQTTKLALALLAITLFLTAFGFNGDNQNFNVRVRAVSCINNKNNTELTVGGTAETSLINPAHSIIRFKVRHPGLWQKNSIEAELSIFK